MMPPRPSLILFLSCASPSLSLANDSALWRTFPPTAPTAFAGAASNALLLPHQPHVFHLRAAPRLQVTNHFRRGNLNFHAARGIPSGIRSNNGSRHRLSMGGRTELGASPWKTDLRTVQEWLQFSDRELAKLNKALPRPDLEQRLGLLADGQTDSVAGFLRVDFRMSKADTRSAMLRFPRLLTMPRETAVNRSDWLVKTLNLNKKQLARMVARWPMLYAYGEETSYAPMVEWLQQYLGLTLKEVARLVVKLPRVFSFKPDGNLDKTVRFLESLGFSRNEVAQVVLKHPEILCYSIEDKIIPTLEWLQMELRASPEEVIGMMAKYPSLVGCSPTRNLAPKLSFLREILKSSVEDIRTAVVSCPSLLGYSLENRIRPRVSLMIERGIDPKFTKHKWLLTTVSKEKFEDWVAENTPRR